MYNYMTSTLSSTDNKHCALYVWVADSATTSHICNKHEAFITYESVCNEIPIYGIDNNITGAEGWGTVIIASTHDQKTHIITLNDVLYVPTNRHCLFSLRRWARSSGKFSGGKFIMLTSRDGVIIVTSPLINNNLYELNLAYHKRTTTAEYAMTGQRQKIS